LEPPKEGVGIGDQQQVGIRRLRAPPDQDGGSAAGDVDATGALGASAQGAHELLQPFGVD
jgi:hypothetical protein